MLRDVLSRIHRKPAAVAMPKTCLEFLRLHEIPGDIISDLEASSYSGRVPLGPLAVAAMSELSPLEIEMYSPMCLVPMPEIVEWNTAINAPCIEKGFLALASGSTGDPIALDRRTRKMVFLSHDRLWERAYEDFSECIQATPFVYEDFWERVLQDDFPWDYYAAQRLWKSQDGGAGSWQSKLWQPDS